MAKKKTSYNPKPVDADGDGIVQEGTEFERPAEVVETEECCQEDCGDCIAPEVTEDAVWTPTPVPNPSLWVADESLSYAALASRFLQDGMKKHDYATHLHQINGGKPINPGTVVKL